jgi:pentose-5-phosphate-3-epimerase
VDLSIDGGITEDTAAVSARSGATFFVCGNSVFASGTVDENLAALRRAVERGAADALR